jgi:hypothetical protein
VTGAQRTVILLLVLILGIRLERTGRIQNAWQALMATSSADASAAGGQTYTPGSGNPAAPGGS